MNAYWHKEALASKDHGRSKQCVMTDQRACAIPPSSDVQDTSSVLHGSNALRGGEKYFTNAQT